MALPSISDQDFDLGEGFLFEKEVTSMAINVLGLMRSVCAVRRCFEDPTDSLNLLIDAVFFAQKMYTDNKIYSDILAKLGCVCKSDTCLFS